MDKIQLSREDNNSLISKVGKYIAKNRVVALLCIILIYAILMSIFNPSKFLSFNNIMMLLLNASAEIFICIAIAILLICGLLDLSLGGTMILVAILAGYFMKKLEWSVPLTLAVCVIISIIPGLINGFIISIMGVNHIITTMATGFIFTGLAVLMAGTGWADFPQAFQVIGRGNILGIQLPIWYMIGFVLLFWYLMTYVRSFRRYYYIGGNSKSAMLSGINVKKSRMLVFVFAAFLAGIGGIIYGSRFNSVMPTAGTGVELRAITACVIGGVSFVGGVGTVLGAVMGVIFIAVMNNCLMMFGLTQNWQFVATGVVFVLSIVIDEVLKRRK
jgi:ribose transport system permease protein